MKYKRQTDIKWHLHTIGIKTRHQGRLTGTRPKSGYPKPDLGDVEEALED